jgi:membrane protease YdiL (CAAX protease family)
MTPFEEQSGEESALLEHRPPRGHPLLAWIVIGLVTVAVAIGQQYRPETDAANDGEKADVNMHEVQSRYFVGIPQVFPLPKKGLVPQIESLYTGSFTVRDRLRVVIVAGEVGGPQEALKWLDRLKAEPLSPEDNSNTNHRLAALLKQLYRGYEAKLDPAVLRPADQEFLRKQMGWAGELALAPEGGPNVEAREAALRPARKVAVTLVGGVAVGCGGVLIGLVLLVLVLLATFRSRARRGFVPGSPFGGIYAETFALWMVVFVGLQIGSLLLPAGRSQLFQGAILSLLSLVVLGWPVLRGVPWKQVREEIGLHFFGQPLRQVLSGPVCYLSSLPLLVFGVVGVVIILILRGKLLAAGRPGGVEEGMHPIVKYLANADGWVLFQIFFAACVAAPLVEEVFFRGVLYRHLRESTKGTGLGWSFLLSGLLTSFLFAVIHPQGILGVPLLMSLALGFTLTREWRGSLVPCMIAHGLNNGLMMLLAVNLFAK